MGEDIRAQPFDVPGYRIMRSLGRGGMADVYLAIQLSLGRHVAIKVLAAERTPSDDLASRFEQEARIIARLDHPHIVGIFDVGRTSTGQLYYTMPHMPNGDLAARDLSQDQAKVIEVARAICQALAYAHEQGIVHRDVKPENVLFDKLNRPLLADFGIALSNVAQLRVTREGNTLGSVAYMSPEQARGRPLDGRSDIYSLGVVCYECLAGKLPFSGEDSMAVALAHVEQPVPRLPPARMHWQSFLDKALAKRPEDRFQTAQEMLEALNGVETRIAIIAPIAAMATSLAGVPEKIERSLNVPVRASPTGAIAIVAVGIALLSAAVLLTFYGPAPASPSRAVTAAANSAPVAAPAGASAPPPAAGFARAGSSIAQPPAATAPTDSVATPVAAGSAAAAESSTQSPAPDEAAPSAPSDAVAADGEPFAQSMLPPPQGAVIHDRGAPPMIVMPAQFSNAGHSYKLGHAVALGAHEVTRGEYAEFVRATGRASVTCRQPGRLWTALEHLSWRNPGFAQDDRHPVVCVSWDDALAYTQWLGKRTHHRYRLPSQAEWLLAARLQGEAGSACRRGNVSDASSGSFLHLAKRFDCNDGFAQTAPVGRFTANALGMHDLLGNASEWTRDCARSVKSGTCPERVFRGISWRDGPDTRNLDASGSARSDVGYTTVGFRLAREIEPDEQVELPASSGTK